jgi:hypothetical protein
LVILAINNNTDFLVITVILVTHLHTPRCTEFLEKPTDSQPVKKFPPFYGTRRIITVCTNARHLPLTSTRSIQYIPPPHSTTSCISIFILTYHLRVDLTNGFFPSVFPNKILYQSLLSSIRATCPAHLILFDLIIRITFGDQYRSLSSSSCTRSSLYSPLTSSFLRSNILFSTLFSNTLSRRSSLNVGGHVSHSYKTTSKICYLGYKSINAAMVLVPLFPKVTSSCFGRIHEGATSVRL